MPKPPLPAMLFALGQRPEPSLREVLASLGIENTVQEMNRKRREAEARRRAAQASLATSMASSLTAAKR